MTLYIHVLNLSISLEEKAQVNDKGYRRQKEPPDVFYKKSCSRKFRKVHRKTPVPNIRPVTLLKRDSGTNVFLRILRNFQ